MPHLTNYKETMRLWVEDHMEMTSEGGTQFTTINIGTMFSTKFVGEESVVRDWLWSYAFDHSDEVLKCS